MANLLNNADFSAPPLSPRLLIGTEHPGKAAAPDWFTWNNNNSRPQVCAFTSTAVLKLGDIDKLTPPGTPAQPQCLGAHDFLKYHPNVGQVLEVVTNGDGNGIDQVFIQTPDPTGPEHTESSVWVYVLRGSVGMGTGFGGSTRVNAVSTKHFEWERLHAPNSGAPATEFILYSQDPDGAWFFVADASVVAV